MPNVTTASVLLNERRVGTLGYRDGSTWFEYEDRDPIHPVLGQAFELAPERRRTASGRLPAWFANLLPEPGSGLRRIIGREIGRENPHDFQVIRFIGEDLPGAVQVVPDSDSTEIPELKENPSGDEAHTVRFSLAGVQMKFSMRWEGKALVLPMSGQGGNWIVKLPDRLYPELPANEFSMLSWARFANIDVPEIKLFQGSQLRGLPKGLISNEELAFGIERFDRSVGARIHQEDFAQVTEVFPEDKYDRATYGGLARFMKDICPEDLDEYMRRLTAFTVMGNVDGHLKNWTLRYPDGRTARLSPAYDFVAVTAYEQFRGQKLAFPVDGVQYPASINIGSFSILARNAGIDVDRVDTVVKETAKALVETWPQVKVECPVPNFVVSHIEDRLRMLPIVQGLLGLFTRHALVECFSVLMGL
jgi:serine/threonine-protein kinase HipA